MFSRVTHHKKSLRSSLPHKLKIEVTFDRGGSSRGNQFVFHADKHVAQACIRRKKGTLCGIGVAKSPTEALKKSLNSLALKVNAHRK